MKILAWPAFSNRNSNPYQFRLYTEIARSNLVRDILFRPRDLVSVILHRYDILHIHWLERVLWGRDQRKVPVRIVCFALSIWLLRLRGVRVVWTVHDAEPHAMVENERTTSGFLRLLWPWYKNVAIGAIDGLIFLSPSHIDTLFLQYPRLSSLPRTVIPHSHYRGLYESGIERSEARARLSLGADQFAFVFVGKLRPYKNAGGLIKSFRQLSDCEACLIVAGEPDTDSYAAELRELASSDARVRLALGFVPNIDLQIYLHGADVVVIPFNECTNSGSVLLALSFDCPVAVPNLPVFRELRELVGDKWIYLFDGPLTGDTLSQIREWANKVDRRFSAPMESLDCDKAAARTIEFYRVLMADRRGRYGDTKC